MRAHATYELTDAYAHTRTHTTRTLRVQPPLEFDVNGLHSVTVIGNSVVLLEHPEDGVLLCYPIVLGSAAEVGD